MVEAFSQNQTANPVRVPVRLVVGSAAALWACYFLLTTARGYVVGLEFQDDLAGRRLLVALAGFAVTLTIWPLLRQLDGRQLAIRVTAALLLMLPASLLIASINAAVFADMEDKVIPNLGQQQGVRIHQDEAGNVLVDVPNMPREVSGSVEVTRRDGTKVVVRPPAISGLGPLKIGHQTRAAANWRQLTDIALGRYFLLLAWAGLYFALGYAEHARAAERREGEHRRAAKASELRSLRYQVNPHFLFNTLNSLSALVLTGKVDAAEKMIHTISTFYRRSLAGDPTVDIPLEEEIRSQRLYLEIEGVRFPDRLRISYQVPEALEQACVPGMILQPLVENSVKYGVAPVSRPVTITLAAREEHGRLVLTVADDGPGAPQDTGNAGCGIGLQNVRDRLAARFGSNATMVSGSTAGGYATIIRIPMASNGC